MRTYFVFILAFVFSDYLFGQIPFAPIGARYMTQTYCPPYNSNPAFLYEITEDSIIQDKYCTKVASGYEFNCSNSYYIYSNNQEVYVYDDINQEFNLVYDFSKQEGESYRIKMCYDYLNTDSATVNILENFHFKLQSYHSSKAKITGCE